MKMKTNSALAVYRLWLSACILIVPLLSCSFFGIPDYELAVTVKEGVQGTPANGQHVYKELTTVEYAYTAVNYLHTVEVVYEGARLAAEGSFTVYTNVALEARLVDIRATWKITLAYADTTTAAIEAIITFSGHDVLSGTFSDDRGYSGTWDGASNKIVITYDNWEKYVLTGTLFDMSGIWANGDGSGTWSATRQ
ncbi:MAG: hypothetical protein WCL37_05345 [Chrysiogenales bacterium]